MSADKDDKLKEAFKKLNDLQLMKKKAKRQRIKMRKRGIRIVQDYCN